MRKNETGRPLVRENIMEEFVEQRKSKDNKAKTPLGLSRFMRKTGLSEDEVVEIWEEHGLKKYGASGDSNRRINVDSPGEISASGSSTVRANIRTDGPIVVNCSGSSTITIKGNTDAIVGTGTSGDANIVTQ